MVRLRARRGFYDRQAKRYRPTGELFDVTDARATEILAAGVAEIVEVLAAPADAPATEIDGNPPKRKRRKG